MPKVIEGSLIAENLSFGIIVSRFNELITSKLLGACLDTLLRHGVDNESIDVMWCPGAYEIPFVARKASEIGRYDALICLGAVIRGSTPHFEYVAAEAARGIAQVAVTSGIPVIYGVLTCDTLEQALERAGTKAGNKGGDAALSAIEMVNLAKVIVQPARIGRR